MIRQLVSTNSIQIYGLIRSKSDELFKHKDISYINYTISQLEKIRAQINAADVWISFIGASGLLQARKITTLYSDSANLLLREAQYSKPSRIIWISSSGIVDNPNDGFLFKWILKPFFLKNMYSDMRAMEQCIIDSKINYTIVRPPYLTDGKLPENVRCTEFYFDDDKSLNRISLACFLAKEIVNPKWEKKIVAVST